MVKIIGLTGHAGAGKDTVAELLEEHGFERFAFADPMRDALLALNPMVFSEGGCAPLSHLVTRLGWDGAKRDADFGPDVRRLLQRFGTEVGRELWDEGFWITKLFDRLDDHYVNGRPWRESHAIWRDARVVVPDVRFANEAAAIHDEGGEVWRIRRPGVGAINDHPSDAGLPDALIDVDIQNDWSLAVLEHAVACALTPQKWVLGMGGVA